VFGPWYGSQEMVDRWVHYVTDEWSTLQPGDYVEAAAAAWTEAGA